MFKDLDPCVKKKLSRSEYLRDFYSLSAILISFSLVVEKYFVMGGGQRISNKYGIHEILMVDVLSARVRKKQLGFQGFFSPAEELEFRTE